MSGSKSKEGGVSLVAKKFSQVASEYQKQAKVQEIIGTRLLSRLVYYKISPKIILDLGAGPGHFSLALQKQFPKAKVISLDISLLMLKQQKWRFRKRPLRLQADMGALPFQNDSVDMVFANQSLHWGGDDLSLFKEIGRVLNKEGLLLFSSLGPDTFKEIKQAWEAVDNYPHVNPFYDMHDMGDKLQHAGLHDPVVDMDFITTRYRTVKALCGDLKSQGVSNSHHLRSKGLMSRKRWEAFEKAYEILRDEDKLLPLTYEVIFGQAWGKLSQANVKNEVSIPLTDIRVKKKISG